MRCLACRNERAFVFAHKLRCCDKTVGVCAKCALGLGGLNAEAFVAKWEKLHGVLCEGGN